MSFSTPTAAPTPTPAATTAGRHAPLILVTGAARRVGAEIARNLHAAGARVALHYRSSAGEAQALAAAFNTLLYDLGVQYPMSGTWLLYQQYANKGYTRTRTYRVGEKIAALHTCWTQKGRLFLYEFLKDFGILPLMESPLPA